MRIIFIVAAAALLAAAAGGPAHAHAFLEHAEPNECRRLWFLWNSHC